jgi:hypothetical protein
MITFNYIGQYGRFGNQIFQYATLFAIAQKRGFEYGVAYSNRSQDDYSNFCLPDCFKNLSAKDSSDINNKNKKREFRFEYNPGIFGIEDNTDICGYFQTEKYFVDYRNQLLKEFEFNQDIKQKAIDIRSISKAPAISIHLRLGDYVIQQQNHPVCSFEYYKKALDLLPDDLMIFVFSDDIKTAINFFQPLKRKTLFVEDTDKYTDMCLMSLCDYHVIANSSFSWWGAWLSNSIKIIAPSKWFGDAPHMPKNWSDIYCKDWFIL